jgi:hypothetical protein
MTITWRGPVSVLSLVAVLVFAGCGGGGDGGTDTGGASTAAQTTASTTAGTDTGGGTATAAGDDFCTKLENIGKNLQDQGSMSDPKKLGAYFSQVADALKAADPPSEVQDDWNTLEDLFSTYANVFSKIDFTDPQSLSGLQDELKKFQDKQDQIVSATTALSKYAAQNCGGGF